MLKIHYDDEKIRNANYHAAILAKGNKISIFFKIMIISIKTYYLNIMYFNLYFSIDVDSFKV